VRQKGYENIVLVGEDVTDITYQPAACRQSYRLVILRKNLSCSEASGYSRRRALLLLSDQPVGPERGGSRWTGPTAGVTNENVVAQLKHGVNAMRMPVDDLVSNGAYMVMAALGVESEGMVALLVPDRERGLELLRWSFGEFSQAILLLPARSCGRRGGLCGGFELQRWLKDLFATFERIMGMELG